jgi:hypothetical protein
MWCELCESEKCFVLLSDYVLRSTAARTVYSALQNAIWADLEKSNMGRGPGKALWIMPKIKCSSMMQYGPSSLDC